MVGKRTNIDNQEKSNETDKFYKLEGKDSALHTTVEFVEKNTSIRFARTYFLTNLSQDYMKDHFFTEDEELRVTSEQGDNNEKNSKLLFELYHSLFKTHTEISNLFLLNKISVEQAEKGVGFEVF